MKFKRKAPGREDEANLIPLINVVFLLLIFFMLAGRFAPSEPTDLTPLQSDSPQGAQPTTRVILIDRAGQMTMNGDPFNEETLAERFAERQPEDTPPLQIKADAALDAMRLIGLLERLQAAGVEQIDLLTLARGSR